MGIFTTMRRLAAIYPALSTSEKAEVERSVRLAIGNPLFGLTALNILVRK